MQRSNIPQRSCQRGSPLSSSQRGSSRGSFQHGGSQWMNSANDVYIRPGTLTEWSLRHIENSPVFHPLEYRVNPQFGTPTTGIYPLGIYYMNLMAQQQCARLNGCVQPGAVRRVVRPMSEVNWAGKVRKN